MRDCEQSPGANNCIAHAGLEYGSYELVHSFASHNKFVESVLLINNEEKSNVPVEYVLKPYEPLFVVVNGVGLYG